jgi:hypothetical protein
VHGLHERRAHVRELDEHLGPDLDVRARVEQQERLPGHRDDHGESGPVDALHALEAEQRGGERRSGGAAADQGLRFTGRHGRDGADDRRLGRATHGPGRVGLLGDGHGRVHHGDMGRHVADGGGRAEQDHAHALSERGTAGDFSGAEIGPVDINRDGGRAASARDRDRGRRACARLRDRRRTRSSGTRGAGDGAVGTAGSR